METSIFSDQTKIPTEKMLKTALGKNLKNWETIRSHVYKMHPDAEEEWKYAGKKFGWNYRIKNKKRVIIYFMPGDGVFMVSLVFGEKAADEALRSDMAESVKTTIRSAKAYAEGRGFRIAVTGSSLVGDIKKLIEIKLTH